MKHEDEPPRQDQRDDPRWADIAPEVEINDRSVELAYQAAKGARTEMIVEALMAGEWVPGDPGPKGRKPIFRTGTTWGGSSKVTGSRKTRLKALGVDVDLGADNPGRPDTPDKVLDLVRSSKKLSWIWRLTTGENPHHPVSKGGTRGGVRAYDRSSTEFHFALHAALLGETPEDIQDALMAMGGKTAEREDYFESNILVPVLDKLEKLGLEWGGTPREIKQDPSVPQKQFSRNRQARESFVAGAELFVPTETLNGVYQAGRAVVVNGKDYKKRSNALRVIAGECIKLGIPEAVVYASFKAANVELSEYDEAWNEVWGRVETGGRPPWIGGLEELVGKDSAGTTLERIRRDVFGLKVKIDLMPFDEIEAEMAAAAAAFGTSVEPDPSEDEPEPDSERTHSASCGHTRKPDPSLIDPADRDPTDRDDYVPPKASASRPSSASTPTAPQTKAKRTPKDVTEDEAIRKPQIFPASLGQLHFAEAKAFIFGKRFNPGGDTALVNTREVLGKIQDNLAGDNRFWFVQKVVAENFVFAGLDLDLITRTVSRGKHKFDALRKAFIEGTAAIKKWKKGEALPKIASLGSIKSTIGHWSYLELSDAISDDLTELKAPFEVKHRATLDQPWSKKDRANMRLMLDRKTKKDDDKAKGPLAFILDSIRCGWLLNERSCTDHNLVSSSPVVCEREVSCKFCRSHLYAWIAEWVTHKWTHDKYVTFEVKATTAEVIKDFREKFEVDANGNKIEKKIEASNAADEASTYTLLPKAYPDEKRFVIPAPGSAAAQKHSYICVRKRRRSQHKVVKRELVSNLLDRIKIGFTRSEDFKGFKSYFGKKLGVRAWPTPDGIRVIMPSTFSEESPVPGMPPEERETLEHLALNGLWKDQKPVVVSKEEALTLILDARRRIGAGFDALVFELAENQPDAKLEEKLEELDGEERDKKLKEEKKKAEKLVEAESALASYPFLRNQAMKPVKNKAAERDLPWFTKGQMREFMKQLAAERRGEDPEDAVAPHECPVLIDDGEGGKKPCRKMLHVGLKSRSGTVAQNNQGRFYAKEEAYDLGEKQGVFTGQREGAFAHAA